MVLPAKDGSRTETMGMAHNYDAPAACQTRLSLSIKLSNSFSSVASELTIGWRHISNMILYARF